MFRIPFNQIFATGRELDYIREAIAGHHLSGDGPFTRRCQTWLEERIGCCRALLTHSATAALEMAAILSRVGTGDEVIMPSFTFVSTANAFVLRGATPVFVDIDERNLNIDVDEVSRAISSRTKAIVPVHYAGVACDMEELAAVATRHSLVLVEDAAQAIGSRYRGRPLGSFGRMAALSFHETKNVISGEGGALLVNDERLIERAEIVREKGTDRARFFRGEVEKYTWIDIGSSYLPNELTAAFLWAQMEEADRIRLERLRVWNRYQEAFEELESSGAVRRPVVGGDREPSGHLYYLLLRDRARRARTLARLRQAGVGAHFHYVPLHSSPAGRKYGRAAGSLKITDSVAERLIRLPMWVGISDAQVDYVVEQVWRAVAD
jgi:dTDP-4-amino-4,6-dideoxygalactose transaminase